MSYDPIIVCKKDGCDNHDCELHHILPKFAEGKDINGRIYLCKKHHDILQLIIPSIIWKYLPIHKKEECKLQIKEFTKRWLKQL